MFKKHLSQQGITLVELLVALVIASLIIGLVTSVLISTVKFNDNTQNRINLRQESNRIVSEIRADHRNDKSICYDNLLASKEINMDMQLNNTTLKKGECFAVKHTNDLPVKFTLSEGPKNTYTIDTVVEGKNSSDLSFTIPEKDSGFIDSLLLDNVFVYASSLFNKGPVLLDDSNRNGGTVLFHNMNNANFEINGNNSVSVQNIYIDKKGKEVIFNSSTRLGNLSTTKIVHITGNLRVNNGGARIWGDSIYIDGETSFGQGSAVIEGKTKVIVNGDVQMSQGAAKIKSDTIYIEGDATFSDSGVIDGKKVIINGSVQINNGSAEIVGDTIYIDGDVALGKNGGLIKGKKVYINGNVEIENWSSKISAEEIYIAGNVKQTNPNAPNIHGTIKDFMKPTIENETIPKPVIFFPPSLRDENWYRQNGYDVRSNGTVLTDNRIFSSGDFKINGGDSTKSNVIIISKGDIEITGNSELSGILIAPNGKVTFKGHTFKGVVIARDGFITRDDTKVYFKNTSEFLKANDPIPFE